MIGEAFSLAQWSAMAPADAAGLWVRRRAAGLSEAETILLGQWLEADPAHQTAFVKAERAWTVFDDANGDELIEAMRDHARAVRGRRWADPRRWSVAATALVTLLSGGLLVHEFGAGDGSEKPDLVIATRTGETRRIGLPDGSTITLDTASRIAEVGGAGSRKVKLLSGQAFFDIVHDAAHPFTVTAAETTVSDLGTQFNLRLDGGALSAQLASGRIEVRHSGGTPVVLDTPGQKLIVSGDGDATLSQVAAGEGQDWRNGLLEFHEQSLATVVGELNRYSTTKLVVPDPRVAAMKVSGSFRAGDPERFGRSIVQLYPLKVVRKGPALIEIDRR